MLRASLSLLLPIIIIPIRQWLRRAYSSPSFLVIDEVVFSPPLSLPNLHIPRDTLPPPPISTLILHTRNKRYIHIQQYLLHIISTCILHTLISSSTDVRILHQGILTRPVHPNQGFVELHCQLSRDSETAASSAESYFLYSPTTTTVSTNTTSTLPPYTHTHPLVHFTQHLYTYIFPLSLAVAADCGRDHTSTLTCLLAEVIPLIIPTAPPLTVSRTAQSLHHGARPTTTAAEAEKLWPA
jgi:hypothetical protein